MRFLVTGGCGFLGSHLTEELLAQGHHVTVLDSLTYAGPLRNIAHLSSPRLSFVYHDFSKPLLRIAEVDYVVHNGAESHVLNSLDSPGMFVSSNIIGTFNLLQWAQKTHCNKFVYVSTDEVFGPAGDEPYHEGDRLKPTNPYSATKAGGEFLTRAYFRSFGVPALITRTCNMFGERQHSEKFVPLAVKKILRGESVDIHACKGVVGSRQWVYAGEQAKALVWLAEHGDPGKAYHVSEGVNKTNLEIAQLIAGILGKDLQYKLKEYAWTGHDLDYSISTKGTPERENWRLKESFEELLVKTIRWYQDNQEFLA
ncbi:MAG: dTDP-glucose 4,6-dehydratase [Candidatus Acidiferrales bacterium]